MNNSARPYTQMAAWLLARQLLLWYPIMYSSAFNVYLIDRRIHH